MSESSNRRTANILPIVPSGSKVTKGLKMRKGRTATKKKTNSYSRNANELLNIPVPSCSRLNQKVVKDLNNLDAHLEETKRAFKRKSEEIIKEHKKRIENVYKNYHTNGEIVKSFLSSCEKAASDEVKYKNRIMGKFKSLCSTQNDFLKEFEEFSRQSDKHCANLETLMREKIPDFNSGSGTPSFLEDRNGPI